MKRKGCDDGHRRHEQHPCKPIQRDWPLCQRRAEAPTCPVPATPRHLTHATSRSMISQMHLTHIPLKHRKRLAGLGRGIPGRDTFKARGRMVWLLQTISTFLPQDACRRHVLIHGCKIFRGRELYSRTEESQDVHGLTRSLLAPAEFSLPSIFLQ